MTRDVIISIDAMGGDNSPRVVIEGLVLAVKKCPNAKFMLFGDESKIFHLIDSNPILKDKVEVIHSLETVSNEDKPSHVIRNKNTSMFMAIEAVKKGEASVVVSAGNTGALMAISKMLLKTLPKISRPAICTIMPHQFGKYVMLDLGANTECNALNLSQFALMGEIFAKTTLGIEKPKVALLNIGAEEMKGKPEIKQASQIIKNSNLSMNFIGYIEPHEIPTGKADVIVADGFTGNIALKSIEGTAKLVMKLLKQFIGGSILAKIGLPFLMPALLKMKNTMDPRLYNGAMFVGLNGLSVKSHGGTDALGFSIAVENAYKLARQNFVPKLSAEIEKIDLEDLTQEMIYDIY
ncbi:MAG: phosphate acyltransferase PlsX [Alphaproteobacteria bacterium]